ncbi:type II toxin-antitoxin system RelE/ParE family toxin [Photorhabdus tasmaniensis]|uniref:Addiction module antidote protein n=1 Tax=Photorhabdus tasmaniensis TaxID=1004159 RepID=A0ABX0GIF9_9GAMM|nr:hypothetical protein [Photorhabdus tasmaniensis]
MVLTSRFHALRIQYSGRPVRAFFAFDPKRQAIVLCAGDKSNDKRFYNTMIRIADEELTAHLAAMKAGVSRETLYRTLSPKGNPTLKTLRNVVAATGFQFSHIAVMI